MNPEESSRPKVLVYLSAVTFLAGLGSRIHGNSNLAVTLFSMTILLVSVYEFYVVRAEGRFDYRVVITTLCALGLTAMWIEPNGWTILVIIGFALVAMVFIKLMSDYITKQKAEIELDFEQRRSVRSVWRLGLLGADELWTDISPRRKWPLVLAYCCVMVTPITVVFVVASIPVRVQSQFPFYVQPFIGLATFSVILGTTFLLGLIAAEVRERKFVEMELRTAHDTQMGLMPTSDPSVSGFDISGLCVPAEEVGGDYFDYIWLNRQKTKFGIAIADVSGKSMKAALTAVMTSGMVYREIGQNQSPKEILRDINRPMYLKTDRRIFTAMSFAVIDLKQKTMKFSNAGQMRPLIIREGKMESLNVQGAHLPLGMAEDVDYRETLLRLRKGDTVVFYTDGIPEAMNAKREMFGFERLEVLVKTGSPSLSSRQLAMMIVENVASFTGPIVQNDDMTVVVLKVKGNR